MSENSIFTIPMSTQMILITLKASKKFENLFVNARFMYLRLLYLQTIQISDIIHNWCDKMVTATEWKDRLHTPKKAFSRSHHKSVFEMYNKV